MLAEYRERLKEAREQAEEIVQRARQTAETHEREAKERGQEVLAEAAKRAEREIEAATSRALDEIRGEVADLTVLAAEKVTRKTLDRGRPAAPRRGGARRARLLRASRPAPRATDGGARPGLRAARCSRSPASSDKLDVLREQLGQFADALDANRELAVFFFSPYFSTEEKQDGARRALLEGADPALLNFLDLLIENHRMPVIFRIRHDYEQLWEEENRLLAVEITSAVELDQATTESLGRTIGERAGRRVELAAQRRPGHHRRHRPARRQLDPRRLDPQPTGAAAQAGRPRSRPRNRTCRSTPTRSRASSRAASRGSTPAAPS